MATTTRLSWGLPIPDQERQRRIEQGETGWPVATVLVNAYNSWHSAVDAAMRLLREGPRAAVPRSWVKTGPPFSRDEALAGLLAFRETQGRWPTATQWDEHARRARRLVKQGGHPDPRLAGVATIRKLFGSFERAIAAVKRQRLRES